MTPRLESDGRQFAIGEGVHGLWTNECQSVHAKDLRPCKTDLIAADQLAQFLDGSSDLLHTDIAGVHNAVLGIWLDLAPGDALYMQGSVGRYAYIVECGLLQCHSQHEELGLPPAVNYVGPREWVGLYDQSDRRQESVDAVARTSLIALPVSELRALSASSPSMSALLSRRASSAMKRSGSVIGSMYELPPYQRAMMGLTHLVHLIAPGVEKNQSDATIRVLISIAMLSYWLALPLSDLRQCLLQLQVNGVLCFDATYITSLSARGLFNAPLSMSYLLPEKHVDKPAPRDLVPAYSLRVGL